MTLSICHHGRSRPHIKPGKGQRTLFVGLRNPMWGRAWSGDRQASDGASGRNYSQPARKLLEPSRLTKARS